MGKAMGLLIGALVLLPVGARAQPMDMPMPAAACAAMDADLPAELSAWTSAKAPVSAASRAAGLSGAALTGGQPASVDLLATAAVTFVAPPGKPADAASHAGLVGFTVSRAGTYVVALGGPAWVDLLKDGAAVASTAHGHGPACSTLRKRVEFPLQPGGYVLQLSGAPDAKLTVLVSPKP
jgi:hypothetical protein